MEVPLVMVPHLDWQRGAPVYGSFSRVLDNVSKPDCVLTLGVNHQRFSHNLFHFTKKRYQTPLGIVENDVEAMSMLESQLSAHALYDDADVHDGDWSIELPLPLLQAAFSSDEGFLHVPIISSSMDHYFESVEPKNDPFVWNFIEALGSLIRRYRESGRKLLVVLAVDLSHQGRFFRDSVTAVGSRENEISDHDLALLGKLEGADPRSVYESMRAEGNTYCWDGFSDIYLAFSAFRHAGVNLSGSLSQYVLTARAEDDCIVSCASMFWNEC
jgi:AmmeMemoRadiSam system protein B